jgi:hypothetical protein
MTNALNNNPILDPEPLDVLLALKSDILYNMNCVKIGQIQSFDGTKKTARVQILFKRIIPDTSTASGTRIQEYPVLVDCPVLTLQGGTGGIQFPITAGDQCLLLFADRNIDAWFQTGSAQAPFDGRCHDLSDGLCIVGLNALTSSLPNYSATLAKVFNGTGFITISPAGVVTIGNGSTSLLMLLVGLITLIEALMVQDGPSELPLTAASIAALEAYKLQLAVLLG